MITFNQLVLPIVAAALLSQVLKVIIKSWKHQESDMSVFLFEPGGMPSTHSAMVTTLTTTLYLAEVDTALFTICLLFSCIVMVDAVGVRREAGENARRINQMLEAFTSKKGKKIKHVREVLGHTPVQVFAGIVIGLLVATFFFSYF